LPYSKQFYAAVERRILSNEFTAHDLSYSGNKGRRVFLIIKANFVRLCQLAADGSKAMMALIDQETLSLGRCLERQLRELAKKSREKGHL